MLIPSSSPHLLNCNITRISISKNLPHIQQQAPPAPSKRVQIQLSHTIDTTTSIVGPSAPCGNARHFDLVTYLRYAVIRSREARFHNLIPLLHLPRNIERGREKERERAQGELISFISSFVSEVISLKTCNQVLEPLLRRYASPSHAQ